MKKKKKTKNNSEELWRAFALATIWSLTVFLLVCTAFNYGINTASGRQTISNNYSPAKLSEIRRHAWSVFMEGLRNRVEFYLRENINALAKNNEDIESGELVAGDINFIADNRTLVFFNDKDYGNHYLAEVVFDKSYYPVKIERFILKIKNDRDYSRGVYGAD
jgi:hypothetical protein